jgi:hypothetical protein
MLIHKDKKQETVHSGAYEKWQKCMDFNTG